MAFDMDIRLCAVAFAAFLLGLGCDSSKKTDIADADALASDASSSPSRDTRPTADARLQSADACTPESDTEICRRLGSTCGASKTTDRCGQLRFVDSCGDCPEGTICELGKRCIEWIRPGAYTGTFVDFNVNADSSAISNSRSTLEPLAGMIVRIPMGELAECPTTSLSAIIQLTPSIEERSFWLHTGDLEIYGAFESPTRASGELVWTRSDLSSCGPPPLTIVRSWTSEWTRGLKPSRDAGADSNTSSPSSIDAQ
jgi:hypothetical protein